MFLYGRSEYRGFTERTSKSGNRYAILKFEDLNTGDQCGMYVKSDARFKTDFRNLKKGFVYDLVFDYHYNDYQKIWVVDLLDIEGESKNNG